jgi:Secretion system C-terminal sorting domain
MKRHLILILFLISAITLYSQTGSAISMASGTSNATAFGSNLTLGSDGGATFYLSWDATYIYIGWSGGKTNYSSDTYFVGIDTDPDGTNGNTSEIMGATFSNSNSQKMDYWIYYENSSSVGGVPVSNGNAFELWQNSSGIWSFVSRTTGNDNVDSRISFTDAGGEVRLRMAWSSLSFTPGNLTKIGIAMWVNNSTTSFIWGSFPTSNPTGATPQQMLNDLVFSSTGSGVNTSTAGSDTPLPVELTSFTASTQGSTVTLSWQTATEVNNYGFEVERTSSSIDDIWEKIGFVEGNGNSNSPKSYSFIDDANSFNKVFYRLKQIDNDGQYEYSNIVEVDLNIPEKFVLEQNYPNPFNPSTTIKFVFEKKTRASLKVYDSIGNEIAELFNGLAESGRVYKLNFDAVSRQGLSSGIYFYKLISDRNIAVKKMILLK